LSPFPTRILGDGDAREDLREIVERKRLSNFVHFKRIHSTKPIFSIRITKDYRAIGVQQEDEIIWFWIGSHSDYDNIVNQLRIA